MGAEQLEPPSLMGPSPDGVGPTHIGKGNLLLSKSVDGSCSPHVHITFTSTRHQCLLA
jgi:hypothetical protein